MLRLLPVFLFFLGLVSLASAVEIDTSGTITYQTAEPTSIQVNHWSTGWPAGGVTGWDYVGNLSGDSGVYLGNGWVITAGHVGANDSSTFALDGVTYTVVSGSETSIGTADLTMFQITSSSGLPNLASLTISSSAPNVNSTVVMIGYGGEGVESWGANRVTYTEVSPVQVNGFSSTDFVTAYGGSNKAVFVGGDSGGGDFIYNSTTQEWELAGVNEATGTGTTNLNDAYMVELSDYASQINSIDGISAVPEPRPWTLIGLGAALTLIVARKMKARFPDR
jgi:hypothetical protein